MFSQIKMAELDITPILQDIEADCNIRKYCESCNTKISRYLYILKSVVYGIFHLCKECKEDLEFLETHIDEIKTKFVEKRKHTWKYGVEQLEEPLR